MFNITRNFSAILRPTGISTQLFSTKRLFVGNLSWTARQEDISSLFAKYGEVKSVRVMIDRNTGRSRGFGFVDMEEDAAAKAIEALDGQNFKGRDLRVNEATPMADRPDRGEYRKNNRDDDQF